MANREIEEKSHEFLRGVYPLIRNYKGQLPNLEDIFRPEAIDWLLTEVVKCTNDEIEPGPLIDFVIRTGYKDKPNVDKEGRIVLCRTTPVHQAAKCNKKYGRLYQNRNNIIIPKLFDIYNRFDLNYIDETGLTHYHVACMFGLAGTVQKFLEHGQDPNYLAQKLVDPPLHLSLTYRRKVVAQLLLRSGANPHSINEKKLTPLHIICKTRCDDIETANMLFEFSDKKYQLVQVNAQDKFGMTPLHYALCYNNLKLSEFLLRKGSNPTLSDVDGLTHLHIVCMRYNDDDDLAETFFKMCDEFQYKLGIDFRDSLGNTPLHMAVNCGNKKAVELLLRRGANLNLANNEGLTTLRMICDRGYDDDLVNIFFTVNDGKHQRLQVNVLDKFGNAPLHYALVFHRGTMAALLLKNGANPNLANKDGSTPLHIICQNVYDNKDFLKMLFEFSNDKFQPVQIDTRDKLGGNTPLHLAIKKKHKNMAEFLLRRGADPNSANAQGFTSLHFISQNYRNDNWPKKFFEICRDVQQTLEVDAQNNLGKTPLHLALALESDDKEVAEILLTNGANPNLADSRGFTPLHVICDQRDDEWLELFFKINDDRHQAVQVNAQNNLGNTPLHLAVTYYTEATKLLLRKGANPNLANVEGLTPLHFICDRNEDSELVKIFFETNKEVNQIVHVDARDNSGLTPLQWAVAKLLLNTVEVLLKHGADLSSFVIPPAIYFPERFMFPVGWWYNFSLSIASRALDVSKREDSSWI
uniref:Uncharacterized protein n=1 Tax=Trichogramma kaykai TaxID=54128 RepID=A0ABD2WG24_9HYME